MLIVSSRIFACIILCETRGRWSYVLNEDTGDCDQ